jgi:hypothetical protein
VAFLIGILGLRRVEDAQAVLGRYFPLEQYPVRTRYILEDLLGRAADA